MRRLVLFAVALGTTAAPFLSQASGYGRGSTFVTAERMFGVAVGTHRIEGQPIGLGLRGTHTTSNTTVGFLWSASPTVHQIPRLGVDVAFSKNLTVGLGGGFYYVNTRRNAEVAGTSFDIGTTETIALLASPRLGWILPLSRADLGIALWLRGGITAYYLRSQTSTIGSPGTAVARSQAESGTALTFEPTMILPLVSLGARAIAMTVAGNADFALGGKVVNDPAAPDGTSSWGSRYHAFGLSFGLSAIL